MEKMKDLKDLLKHEVMDLYSAEEQIIEALPKMIDKARDPALKKALREHLNVTQKQKARLDKVQQLLREKGEELPAEKKGFLSGLFGGGGHKCKGTQGLIEEGEKIMGEDMNTEVMDAAIIASAQKIEHYEICGYGTAKAFALELKLNNVAELLDQTLNEEYSADNLLTKMAVGRLNQEAEQADGMHRPGKTQGTQNSRMPAKSNSAKTSSKKGATASKTQSKPSANSRPSSGSFKKSSAPAKKGTASATKKSSGTSNSKTAAKKTAPKKSSRPRLAR